MRLTMMTRATTTTKRKTLYLIDGHGQFFRAYHALRSGMTSPVTKEPTNMTFGFVGILLKLLRDYEPDYLAVVVDVSGDRESFRSQLYPEYKANRDPAPDDFGLQVKRCIEILELMRIPVLGMESVEADDVIATLVRRLQRDHSEIDIRIVSRDKDLSQLIGDHVELLDVHKDQPVTPEQLFKYEGVKPENVRDILALMGDTSDNIPGVPGIGPKTASQLIVQYGSLDELLAHLDEIKGKRRENIEAARQTLALSRQLVTLKDDLDIALDLDAARTESSKIQAEPLLDLLRELGFNRHREELRAMTQQSAGRSAEAIDDADMDDDPDGFSDNLFAAATVDESSRPRKIDVDVVESREQLDQLVADAKQAGSMAVATFSDQMAPMTDALCGLAISIGRDGEPSTRYVPLQTPAPDRHLDMATMLAQLKPVLESDQIAKIGHNIKADITLLRRNGIALHGVSFDTMIAAYVVDSSRASFALDVLTLALLGSPCQTISELLGKGRQRRSCQQIPVADAAQFAGERVQAVHRLHSVLDDALGDSRLRELFTDLEMPLSAVLAEMEFNGIRIDPDELDRQRNRLGKRIDELRAEIVAASPHPFNPDSPKQLALALFNADDADPPGLGLPVFKRGKTGPSTDVEVLEKLAADPAVDSPVPELIVEYRQLTKLVGTYLVALKDAINPQTHRVHATFHQTGAATGRLSSSDPNLQNIPIRTEIGREIRRAFVAEAGQVLISADYSQVELRLLAHLSEDEGLIEAFEQGVDIHRVVAGEVYGVDPDAVTAPQRHTAKMVNFGIVYGITPYGLARRLGPDVSVADARGIIEGYKQRFGRIGTFLAECVDAAHTDGYVQTMLGRRRMIPQVQARHPQTRAFGERAAINSVVQGSAADLIKLAMVDLHRRLPDEFPGVRLLLSIHDELVLEAPEDSAQPVSAFVRQRMESAMDLRVPLVVETAFSPNWIDAK